MNKILIHAVGTDGTITAPVKVTVKRV